MSRLPRVLLDTKLLPLDTKLPHKRSPGSGEHFLEPVMFES